MFSSLYQFKKDRCDICCCFETKQIGEEEYQEHQRKTERARQEKTKTRNWQRKAEKV